MRRPMMNTLKQKWKDFTVWFVEYCGYTNTKISKCSIEYTTYFKTKIRHDNDNETPKFINDGLVEAGLIVDDDSLHLNPLVLRCYTDKENPRTEIKITIMEDKDNE